jgi:hypothetical protein
MFVLLTKFYSNDQIKNELGVAGGTYGGEEMGHRVVCMAGST